MPSKSCNVCKRSLSSFYQLLFYLKFSKIIFNIYIYFNFILCKATEQWYLLVLFLCRNNNSLLSNNEIRITRPILLAIERMHVTRPIRDHRSKQFSE